jgi:hypothetical protein
MQRDRTKMQRDRTILKVKQRDRKKEFLKST